MSGLNKKFFSITFCFVFAFLSWTEDPTKDVDIKYTLTESAPKEIIATHCKIMMDLDIKQGQFKTKAKVSVKNNTAFSVDRICFWILGTDIYVSDYKYTELHMRIADTNKVTGVKLIEAVLDKPLASGEEKEFFIDYRSIPSPNKELFCISEEYTRILDESGWYPVFKKTAKEKNPYFNWDLRVTVKKGINVTTDGKFLYKKPQGKGITFAYESAGPSNKLSFTAKPSR